MLNECHHLSGVQGIFAIPELHDALSKYEIKFPVFVIKLSDIIFGFTREQILLKTFEGDIDGYIGNINFELIGAAPFITAHYERKRKGNYCELYIFIDICHKLYI